VSASGKTACAALRAGFKPGEGKLATRVWFLAAVLLLVIARAPADAKTGGATVRLAVGGSTMVTLASNPSTGYGWRINTARSVNLGAVAIEDIGYQSGSGQMPGAAGVHRWRVRAKALGDVRIVFDYARPWEHVAPADRYTLRVKIGRGR